MTKIILTVVGALICLYVTYTIFGFFYSVNKLREHDQTEKVVPMDTTINEYSSLLPPTIYSSSHPGFSYLMNHRAPFSTFDIKDDNCLIISKLSNSANLALNDIRVDNRAHNDGSLDSFYNVINENYFELSHLCSEPGLIRAVYLSVDGDVVDRILVNDTTLKLRCKLKSFSIKYSVNGPIDMYARVKSIGLPMDIYYLKRNKTLYFLLMSVNNIDSTRLVDLF